MQKNNLNWSLKIINLVLTLGVFYFAYVYGRGLVRETDFTALHGRLWVLAFSFVLFGIFYLLLSIHWFRICRIIDPSCSKKQMLAFFASQPYKYLPTSLFTFSYRAKFARDVGLSLKKSTIAQLIENGSIFVSGFLVAGSLYAVSRHAAFIVLPALFLLIIYVFLPGHITVTIRHRKLKMPTRELLFNVAIASSAWVIAGLSFLGVNYALGLSIDPLLAIAANALAYVTGILAFFAPGGVGVREVILLFFSVASSAIVVWRLLTFVSDLLFGLLANLAIAYQIED